MDNFYFLVDETVKALYIVEAETQTEAFEKFQNDQARRVISEVKDREIIRVSKNEW